MMKTYLLPSTLLFFLIPIHLPNFNIPRGSEIGVDIIEPNMDQVANPVYVMAEKGLGKGIKDKRTN